MGKHLFKLSNNGKLDIDVKVFNENDELIYKSSNTYDHKPLIDSMVKECSNIQGAYKIEIFSTPSEQRRTFIVKK